ncbi:murein biosynthesis integral membrane protein MurJ [Thermosediminibacter oceani]|uniref:Probable lipid II flippase MurJ n=1 Tax=Thermosediminibacter oceani (strain ATCC BAA-1034 / DSM 16646 / JW/IW-1228P) TaxID=555079 RepID=D9RYW5_THEOJ|nr:murein biosynthesis integral membrane protein MurJ [Thermosediminibacter oceani]ADL08539.1 integral membrane protein MviN [Thermosediminibacter oceani DSM 16646]
MTEAGRSSTAAARAAAVIMIATLLSKILGFFRELLIGSKFGATSVTDAYLVSLTVPAVLFATVAGALSTSFIPVYSEIEAKKGRERAVGFAGNLFNVILIVSLMFSLFGAVFSRLLVKLVAMGFSGETLEMAAAFTRITMFMSAFVALANVLTGYLQSNREFTVPAVIGIPYNVIIISALLFSEVLGIWGLVVATVVAAAFQVLIQLPAAVKKGFKFTPGIDFADEDLKRMGILIIPVVLGTGVSQLNVLVDRMLASSLEEGTIAALNFASRLNGFVYGIFTLSVATVIYPSLSRLSAEGDMEGFKRTLGRALGFVIAIVMPLSAGAMVLRVPIVRFLFERGAFDSRATFMTATALLYFSAGMVGFGLRDVLSRAFYSLRDTATPMVNGAVAVGINVVLNLILVKFMGLGGLALATSISALAGTAMLFYSLRRKIGPLGGRRILMSFVKSIAACAVMSAAVHNVYGMMSNVFVPRALVYQALDLGVSVLAGVLVYLTIVLILRMDDVVWAAKAFITARFKR